MDKIKEVFYKHWDKEKSDKFYESLESSVLSYKVECLEKFIEDIFEENPSVKRDEILRYAKNMDAFTDAEEFLIDFFKSTRTPEGNAVAARLEDNPEEVERLLNGLLASKRIRIKENENEFIVWYI
ncbi:hypothetical protein [Cetobacterium sp.]|uniref:hypothetical protein n=1 Tax=Cetobacterium sp. TaxID=2071632 RepID=UPI003EE544C7